MPTSDAGRGFGRAAAAALLVVCAAGPAGAQSPGEGTLPLGALHRADVTPGSAAERTALILNLLGRERPSVLRRGAGMRLDSLAAEAGFDATQLPRERRWVSYGWPEIGVDANSAARQAADGAVWQGKGLTASASGGVQLRKWVFSLSVRPIAFTTQNLAFVPRYGAPSGFRDPAWGARIDLPYRFGDASYSAFFPGESDAEIDLRWIATGFGTGTETWGPAHVYPLVLGSEAPGFPRGYVAVRDLPLFIGRVSSRWIMGVLEPSPYTTLAPGNRSRVAPAMTVSFTPRGLDGLEVGASRFYHIRKKAGSVSWENAKRPFGGLLKNTSGDPLLGGNNQIASVYLRVAPPGAGAEVYGELYREDHNADLRDLAVMPDHAAAYTIGVRRAWRSGGEVSALTIERANGRISHLERVRAQGVVYTHTEIVEGHTYRGQPLGSSAVMGGAAMMVMFDRIGVTRSRYAFFQVRPDAQNEEGGSWSGEQIGRFELTVGQREIRRGRTYGMALSVLQRYGTDHGFETGLSVSVR